MQDNNTPAGFDPLDLLERSMGNMPGGGYLIAMLRNNPDARDALAGIRPGDPDSMVDGMRRLLAVFGLVGPPVEMMLDQMRTMMADPAAMQQYMQSQGLDPAAMDASVAAAMGQTPVRDRTMGEDVEPTGNTPPPAALPAGPPWRTLPAQVVQLVEDGAERTAIERMLACLDDEQSAAFDPRNPAHDDLTGVLELLATTCDAVGRQIPLRLRDLYQRLAWHRGVAPPPEDNPTFTQWAVALADGELDPAPTAE